jgi:hypothetical protein
MLVNIYHDSPREHRRLMVAGVAFLTVVALLISLSIAIYQKVFEPATTVRIHADRAGLQLAKFGDVRLNGALVGQVRKVSQDGEEAVIEVALQPEEADQIPDNVSVQILPTTLFGQKFVSFVPPDEPSGHALSDGDVIPAARYAPRLARTFEGNQVKQYIEFGTAQYRAYDERDRPTYGEVGHGPWCLGLPDPQVPAPPIALDQGSDMDEHPPTSPLPGLALPGLGRVGADYSGTAGERQIVNALIAGLTGRSADTYGSLGSLLYGPVVSSPAGGRR